MDDLEYTWIGVGTATVTDPTVKRLRKKNPIGFSAPTEKEANGKYVGSRVSRNPRGNSGQKRS